MTIIKGVIVGTHRGKSRRFLITGFHEYHKIAPENLSFHNYDEFSRKCWDIKPHIEGWTTWNSEIVLCLREYWGERNPGGNKIKILSHLTKRAGRELTILLEFISYLRKQNKKKRTKKKKKKKNITSSKT